MVMQRQDSDAISNSVVRFEEHPVVFAPLSNGLTLPETYCLLEDTHQNFGLYSVAGVKTSKGISAGNHDTRRDMEDLGDTHFMAVIFLGVNGVFTCL